MCSIIGVLCDNSGSMEEMNPRETTQSLNNSIKDMGNDETVIFAARFSDTYNLFIDGTPKPQVTITEEDIKPDGMTALYDGIGKFCADIDLRIETIKQSNNEVNDVFIIILTDGFENCSREYSKALIKKILTQKEKQNWKFVFLGANQDAIMVGKDIGLSRGQCCTFNSNADSLNIALKSVGAAYTRSQEPDEIFEFSKEERESCII